MSSGLDDAVDSTDDAQSHSFKPSTENTTFQSRSSTLQAACCNNDRSDESNENKDIESSFECENTNDVDVEGKEKKSSREKMKEMLSNWRNKKQK